MILGMSTSLFTAVHVILSLIGILSGLIVLWGLLRSRRLPGWTGIFLLSTVLTSATGFLFHSKSFGQPHAVGVISLAVLAVSLLALYGKHLFRNWRAIYVVSAISALYLNVVVGVVQAFQKLPFLQPLAPTQSEPPFLVAQLLVLAVFVILAVKAVRRFHPETAITMAARISA
jgi:hypothetical protein